MCVCIVCVCVCVRVCGCVCVVCVCVCVLFGVVVFVEQSSYFWLVMKSFSLNWILGYWRMFEEGHDQSDYDCTVCNRHTTDTVPCTRTIDKLNINLSTFDSWLINLFIAIYILHFTFYILQFTFYVLHFTFTFYNSHFTFYILHFTFYILQGGEVNCVTRYFSEKDRIK